MKTTLMTMVLSTVAFAALAQEATPDTWMSESKSVASSASVRSEAMQQRASGEFARLDSPGYLPSVMNPRLRAEVVAELHAARQSGEFAMLSAEAHSFTPVHGAPTYAYRQLMAGRR
jgi:hypothetical protein